MAVPPVTRMPDTVTAVVVRHGVFSSRSEAVGLDPVVGRERRAVIGRSIVDGYRQLPQEDHDLAWADAASATMIAEEPW